MDDIRVFIDENKSPRSTTFPFLLIEQRKKNFYKMAAAMDKVYVGIGGRGCKCVDI